MVTTMPWRLHDFEPPIGKVDVIAGCVLVAALVVIVAAFGF